MTGRRIDGIRGIEDMNGIVKACKIRRAMDTERRSRLLFCASSSLFTLEVVTNSLYSGSRTLILMHINDASRWPAGAYLVLPQLLFLYTSIYSGEHYSLGPRNRTTAVQQVSIR